MPHRIFYQYVNRFVHDEKINLIKYSEFRQPPDESVVYKDNRTQTIKKLWNKTTVNLCLLKNLDSYDDIDVGSLKIEFKNFVHDNVLKVYGLTYDGKNYFFVREYAAIDLRSYLNQKNSEGAPLEWNKKLLITSQIVDGLKFLHSKGFVHSDMILKNISLEQKIESPPVRKPSDINNIDCKLDEDCQLDFYDMLNVNKLRVEFINRFALNKGRNINGFDFSRANEFILYDHSDPKICKVYKQPPIFYIPKNLVSPWMKLNKFSLFENQDTEIEGLNDDAQIHFPIATVQYTCKTTDKFIQDIKDVLKNSDQSEYKRNLEKVFNNYGHYVATKVTLGGVLTIKNWSRVSAESRSYLRCYIQWGIDYGQGSASRIFEDVPLNNIPKLEATMFMGTMRTIGNLYSWFKNLYDCKFAEIISYDEVIPSYELLPDDFKKELFKLTKLVSDKKPYETLIPNIPTECEKQDMTKWIIKNPPIGIFFSNWIYDFSLQRGVILQHSGLERGRSSAFKFLKEPKITELNKITILLAQPKTRKEAYMLENGIILKDELELENVPFADYSSIFSQNDKYPKTIYCQIIFHAIKLSSKLLDFKALSDFSIMVNSALQDNMPYKKLSELFGNNYGHLLPRTLILGGILSKTYESYTDIILPQNIVFEYDMNDPQTPKNIEEKLNEWNSQFQHLDTSVFFSNSGDVVHRNKIKDWLMDLSENKRSWNVVTFEDWTPLYKVLKRTQQKIDEIFDETYHIVFNGEESLTQDQTTTIIKFPGPLIDDKYYIFGVVVRRNRLKGLDKYEGIPKISVRFDYPNNNSCVAYIYKNCDESLLIEADMKLLWFVLANPKGYCSGINRSIKVTYGELNVDNTQPVVAQPTSKELTSNCVLITSIVSRKDTIFYNIKPKNWSKTKINIEILEECIIPVDNSKKDEDDGFGDKDSDDGFDDKNSDDDLPEQVVLRWCVIDASEREAIVSLGNMCPLSLFGNYLNIEDEIFENTENVPRFPPQMLLEDAIKQHTIPNGNTLEAWKTFVNHSRKGNFIADYWIGYYLQQDILKSKNLYENSIEPVIQEESPYTQAAMGYFKKSADNNYSEAQLRYGYGLYYGKGVNKDQKEAIRYFKLGAENDNITAMYNLGIIWIFSNSQNEKEEGEKWLIKAAGLNHQKAIEVCDQRKINYRE
ncbi:9911_t:CDS:2 [Scutellospora calospora]|uniref:9911_t:CDS:1 n=1 Tax=Scutellospora calospora TaxID=85575 RepID=A0ACA9K5G0_9GLOM|nr:9911_t:CDS:2 [Scutellospora calospora]